jgi:hypothetical protein
MVRLQVVWLAVQTGLEQTQETALHLCLRLAAT